MTRAVTAYFSLAILCVFCAVLALFIGGMTDYNATHIRMAPSTEGAR